MMMLRMEIMLKVRPPPLPNVAVFALAIDIFIDHVSISSNLPFPDAEVGDDDVANGAVNLDAVVNHEVDNAAVDPSGQGHQPPSNFRLRHSSIDMTHRFATFPMLTEHMHDHAVRAGFVLTQKPKQYFTTSTWPFDSPFMRKVSKRGWCVCSPRSRNRIPNSPCPFKIVYGWSIATSSYQIHSGLSILTHNHFDNPR